MNFGMRCHDICGKGPMTEVFDAVKANNIDQIQLALGKSVSDYDFTPGHYSPGLGRMIGKELEKRGIHVAILGCYINPTNPNEEKRQAEVKKFIEHLKYAKAMGADMVGTETGRYSEDFQVVPETYTEENYQLLLKSMREIVAAAEKIGVVVGVEAVHDHTLSTPEKMKRFLDDINSPMVEAILDPVNLIAPENAAKEAQKEIIDKAFALYGDRISAVHIKDFRVENGQQVFEHVADGLFDYYPLMAHLKKEKPYVAMLLENSNPGRYHKDVEFLTKIYEEV